MIVWKNQTTESFPKVKNYSLASEILDLEIPKEPEINLDTIQLAEGQVKIDFEFVEQIFDDNEETDSFKIKLLILQNFTDALDVDKISMN